MHSSGRIKILVFVEFQTWEIHINEITKEITLHSYCED